MTNLSSPPVWPLVSSRPLPRLHVISDLHMEDGPYEIPADLEYDILVAAGDIGPPEVAVPWLAKHGKPAIYVLGNHERWGTEMLAAVARARELAKDTQVHVLERDSVVVQGVRFLGATLWTDFRGFTREFVGAVSRMLRDYEHVTCEQWLASPARLKKLEALCKRHDLAMPKAGEDGRWALHPGIVYLEHQESRTWLKRQLANKFSGPTVVVTHHAPTFESLVRNGISREELKVQRWSFRDDQPVRIAGYASEGVLQDVDARKAMLWVHGHTHSGMDYLEQSVRILCNPRGRPTRPLTQDDIKGYALFGLRVTEDDIKRSQEVHAKDPYRGNGRGFEPRLVVDFENFLERPLTRAVAQPLEELVALRDQVEGLVPHVGKLSTVAQRCVAESIEARLTAAAGVLETLHASVVSQLVRYWDTPALRGIALPRVPSISSSFESSGWRASAQQLRETEDQLQAALDWVRTLPTLPQRVLVASGHAAAKAIHAARAAGYELALQRMPAKALKRADPRELRFIALNEAALAEDPQYKLEMLLDQTLNGGKIPRAWLTRVDEPSASQRQVPARYLRAYLAAPGHLDAIVDEDA